ncbi:hypothetical protein Poli38472_010009 [Pythium oligandrum]|uniref:Uncharacterized protein n=1 Tax=Pythium oligandrum TaxID=41045 RepID=A0A8K1C8K1_PYTOL|nr:hypothetical protein Poli38472_010009 [Pythium oligandrum]|eukprot:TMW58450.1 hypothetical protein Poli38472_010009 [Pythium oligandrum]
MSKETSSNIVGKTANVSLLELGNLLLDDPAVKVDRRLSLSQAMGSFSKSPNGNIVASMRRTKAFPHGPTVSDLPTAEQSVHANELRPQTETSPTKALSSSDTKHAGSPSAESVLQTLQQRLTHEEKVSFVMKMSQVLFVCEFVVLIEFTEVIVPVMYSIYIAAMSHLVNRAYYPQLANMSDSHLHRTIGNVLTYSALEFASFLLITIMLKR